MRFNGKIHKSGNSYVISVTELVRSGAVKNGDRILAEIIDIWKGDD